MVRWVDSEVGDSGGGEYGAGSTVELKLEWSDLDLDRAGVFEQCN